MNKPANKPWNKISFWRSVRKCFNASPYSFFCICSPAFSQVYQNPHNRRTLNSLANKFLKETGQKHLVHAWKNYESGPTVIFNCKKDDNERPIRTQFIRWNIKRLTPKA